MLDSIISLVGGSGALMSLNKETLLIGYGSCQRAQSRQELDPSRPIFYLSDFFLQDRFPWLQYAQWKEISIKEIQKESTFSYSKSSLEWHLSHQEIFQKSFAELKHHFSLQKLKKAVMYTFAYCLEKMSLQQLKYSIAQALKSIQTHDGYLYGYWNAQKGVLGVTPEILFKCHQTGQLETMALAGTSPYSTCQVKFIQDHKELQEHQLVVEGIKESLASFGTVQTGELQVLSLATLNHLMTPIKATLFKPVDFEKLVKALHPTPALGAFPKQEGRDWLQQYQQLVNRGYYGAPIGVITPYSKFVKCLVAIRNVQWSEKGMSIGAGCGIIPDSQYEKEWKEIQLKIEATRSLLAL